MEQSSVKRTTLSALALVILLLIATSPFWTILLIRQNALSITNDEIPGLITCSMVNLGASEGFLELGIAVHTTDESVRQQCLNRIGISTHKVDLELEAHRATLTSQAERNIYENLVQSRAAFRETRRKVIDLIQTGKSEEAVPLFHGVCATQFEAYLTSLKAVVEKNVADTKARGVEIFRLCNIFLLIQTILVVFFLIYAFFVPFIAILEKLTRRTGVQDL